MAPVIGILLLLGIGAEALTRPRPAEAEPYHLAVRNAAAELPMTFGGWSGSDQPVTEDAKTLLKPNVIYSRRFENGVSKLPIEVMIVHCKDTRQIDGHYPPVCYPAHGWVIKSTVPGNADIDGVHIEETAYEFTLHKPDATEYMLVDNFIVTPSGRVVRDMNVVRRQSADYLTRHQGAASVQIVFHDPNLTESERREIFNTMVQAHMPLIKTILAGVTQVAGAQR